MTTENNTETARPAGPSTPGNYLATSGDSCWPLTQGVAHLPGASQILNNCFFTLSGTTAVTAVTAIRVGTASP